jgi:hypothetical protein
MMAGLIMLPAVDFNCEANRRAIKIKNVRADWMLTPKTQAIELTTLQHIPKFSFRPCGIAAQTSSARGCLLSS